MATHSDKLIGETNTTSPAADSAAATPMGNANPVAAYSYDSCEFYSGIISPGELGIVAAESGGMKTMFLCNLACILATNNTRVGFISVQMDPMLLLRRLHCMITDFPYEQCDTTEGLDQLNGLISTCKHIDNIKLCTATGLPAVARSVADMAQAGCSVVIIDGFDSVENQHTTHLEMNKLIGILPQLAKQLNISLWITSQVKVSADAVEIISKSELSATSVKAQEAAIVITLGHRLEGLRTALIVKNRPQNKLQAAYRLIFRPSYRLEVIPEPDLDHRLGNGPYVTSNPPPSERINALPGDFPGDEHNDGENDDVPTYTGSLKPYHGTKGFVPVGRAVFSSAIFQNLDHEQFFWLMDLYAMACFLPEKPYAPGTQIPVPIKPGQVMTSWNTLRKRWGKKFDRPIRTFLEKAEKEGLLAQERVLADGTRIATKGGTLAGTQKAICTVITLCHYIQYKKSEKHDVGDSA